MFETPELFGHLLGNGPMNQRQLQRDQLRTQLEDVGTEIRRLKSKSAENGNDGTSRFDCYLASLEASHLELVDDVDKALEPGANHWSAMVNGFDELNDRLAIAKLAAKSRVQ